MDSRPSFEPGILLSVIYSGPTLGSILTLGNVHVHPRVGYCLSHPPKFFSQWKFFSLASIRLKLCKPLGPFKYYVRMIHSCNLRIYEFLSLLTLYLNSTYFHPAKKFTYFKRHKDVNPYTYWRCHQARSLSGTILRDFYVKMTS